jgi:hypothetical protein
MFFAKFRQRSSLASPVCAAVLACAVPCHAQTAPKLLFDPASPNAAKQIEIVKSDYKRPGNPGPYTDFKIDKTGIEVTTPGYVQGAADHPGIHIYPAEGTSWDLSKYGHVEATVTNTGTSVFGINLHVIDDKDGSWTENNSEFVNVKPGETRTLKVIFGYSRGFRPIGTANPATILQLFFYLYHSASPHSFRLENIVAAGVPGEKPDPALVVIPPPRTPPAATPAPAPKP